MGDTRIIKKFLIIPVCIGDKTRWLKMVEFEQTLKYCQDVTTGSLSYIWVNTKWIN